MHKCPLFSHAVENIIMHHHTNIVIVHTHTHTHTHRHTHTVLSCLPPPFHWAVGWSWAWCCCGLAPADVSLSRIDGLVMSSSCGTRPGGCEGSRALRSSWYFPNKSRLNQRLVSDPVPPPELRWWRYYIQQHFKSGSGYKAYSLWVLMCGANTNTVVQISHWQLPSLTSLLKPQSSYTDTASVRTRFL